MTRSKRRASRARQAVEAADLLVVVLDRSRPLDDEDRQLLHDTNNRVRVVVASKSDLAAEWEPDAPVIEVSALTDEGVASLREALCAAAGIDELREHAPVANQRHVALLEKAREALARAAKAADERTPEEFVLADLHEARARFDEVTGARPQDEVLALIFERFCIGK